MTYSTLKDFFKQHPKVALAFSGGTDSAYLFYAALQEGCDIKPYFVQSAFQPAFELKDALRLSKALNVEVEIIRADILACADVVGNDNYRCYYCKQHLFKALLAKATEAGYPVLIDGTNASDDENERPGMRALKELGVYSPLRICGITKEQVRQLSVEAGLFTASKPSYACLATRIPTGTSLTQAILHQAEEAEQQLFNLGFVDFRVRILDRGTIAKIQMPQAQWQQVIEQHDTIHKLLSAHFAEVVLDLKPRQGE